MQKLYMSLININLFECFSVDVYIYDFQQFYLLCSMNDFIAHASLPYV